MGACDFWTTANGSDAKAAFRQAREDALYENGHGGYSGTIAEKPSFKKLSVPAGVDPTEFARRVSADAQDGRDPHGYLNKWGPALCVQVTDSEYLFFGIASS